MKNYKQEIINSVATALKSYGYTVYLDKSKTYGFYTDGKKAHNIQFLTAKFYAGGLSKPNPRLP